MRILAVMCATEENEGLRRTKKTLEMHGIECRVFGMGQQWQGNGMKQVAAWKTALDVIGKYDCLLSLDGFDVLCLADEDEIAEKFGAFQHPMVISAEMNCWPDAKMACRYPLPRTTSPFRFLNGGVYMARVNYLAAVLTEWGITEEFRAGSDQGFLTGKFLEHPQSMFIDEQCHLFQSLAGVKPEDFMESGKRVISRTTYRMPCFLHGNGHTNMEVYWNMINR